MERAATDGLRRDEVCGTCWTFRVYIMLLGMSFPFLLCVRCAAPPSMVKPPYCSFSHWVRRASLWLCKIAHCLALWDLHGCALVKLLGSSARNHLPWSSTERPRVREEAIRQLVVSCSWRTHHPGHQPLFMFFLFSWKCWARRFNGCHVVWRWRTPSGYQCLAARDRGLGVVCVYGWM